MKVVYNIPPYSQGKKKNNAWLWETDNWAEENKSQSQLNSHGGKRKNGNRKPN